MYMNRIIRNLLFSSFSFPSAYFFLDTFIVIYTLNFIHLIDVSLVYWYYKICLLIHLLMDIWSIFIFWIMHTNMLWTVLYYKSLHILLFILGKYLKCGMSGYFFQGVLSICIPTKQNFIFVFERFLLGIEFSFIRFYLF